MQFFILPPFLRSKHAFGTRLAFQSDPTATDRPSELKMRMEDGGQGPKERAATPLQSRESQADLVCILENDKFGLRITWTSTSNLPCR